MYRRESFTFAMTKEERRLQQEVAKAMRRNQGDMIRFLTWRKAVELGVIKLRQSGEVANNGKH